MDLNFLELQYSKRSSVVLKKLIGFFGITVQLFSDEADEYSDVYGVSKGIDTGYIGEGQGLLFNYDMTPVSYMNASVFTGGYLYFLDPQFDLAKSVKIMNRNGEDGRTYKLEQEEGQGVGGQLFKVRKLVSLTV